MIDKTKKKLNPKVQWAKFIAVLVLYLLFLYWVKSWWGLLAVPFIFDIYITKKIKWQWWKESEGPVKFVMSWVDALVFALVAVYFINQFFFQNYVIPSSSLEKSLLTGDYLFVSKVSYGPRIPQTPLTMPSLKHTLNSALGIKSEDAKDSDAEHAGASADAKPSSVMFAGSDEDENRRKHILIIDDSPLVLKTVNNILKEKYDVSLARGGEPAYTYLEKNKTDLILIDYEMPGENGPSVLTNIRKMRNGQKVPAVYLTGVKDTASFMEAVKTHPQCYPNWKKFWGSNHGNAVHH